MTQEKEEQRETRLADFIELLVAHHPDKASDIIKIFAPDPDEPADFADPLSEEEMENYQPLSVDEIDHAISDLRRFGLHVS